MELNLGVKGAKVQSWREANPREPLLRLVRENPDADKAQITAIYWEFLQTPEGQRYLFPCIESWVSNNYHALMYSSGTPREVTKRMAAKQDEQREELTEQVKERLEQHVEKRVQVALLGLMMPNGKTLSECTGKDCRKLGPKVGSWLTKIGSMIKANEKVGDKMSEAQVRKLYR